MYRPLAWVGLLLGTAVVLADEPPPLLPVPRVNTQLPPPTRSSEKPLPMPYANGPASSRRNATPDSGHDPQALQIEIARLRKEREALQGEREKVDQQAAEATTPSQAEAARLRLRLGELLLQLRTARPAEQPSMQRPPTSNGKAADPPGKPPVESGAPAEPPPAPEGAGQLLDPMALAQSLFRAGDYEAALGTFRLLDPNALELDDRVMVQYLMACCQRKLGKFEEAATLFREVANAKEAPVLADCAQWQLSALSWRRDMEGQLLQLRKRRQAVESKP